MGRATWKFRGSSENADLLGQPRDAAKDLLTKKVIEAIDAASPKSDSPADKLRTLLKSENSVKELDQRVKEYSKRVKDKLITVPLEVEQ